MNFIQDFRGITEDKVGRQPRADAGGAPWVIQPELVTGCSWRFGGGNGGLCAFCGLNAIRTGPGQYEYMSMEIAARIVEQVAEFCPNARVEFAMRGEPLMHPKAAEIITLFRSAIPKVSLMLTTNGDTIRGPKIQERIARLFDAGLNLLLIDTYYPKERRDELREQVLALRGGPWGVADFFTEWAGFGHSPYSRQHYTTKQIVLMDDLQVMDGVHSSRQVKTHAGANPTKQIAEPFKRNCGRPFRELVIHSDGWVPLCCDDWQQEYRVANVMDTSLAEIWRHPRFEAARARLFAKDRAFGPCKACDAPMAPRTGLLPLYEPPTDEQVALTDTTFIPKEALWRR